MREEEKEKRLEYMMDTYGNQIMRLCFLYLKDFHLAEDAAQETFIKAYANIDSLKKRSAEEAWIKSIAANTCKNIIRKNWFQKERLPISDNILEYTELKNKEIEQTLAKGIQSLPDACRETVVLFYYGEYSIKEIAEFLGVKESAVLQRLKRGRDRLRELLKEDSHGQHQKSAR